MAGYYEYTPQERKREVDATISSLCFAVTSLITSAACYYMAYLGYLPLPPPGFLSLVFRRIRDTMVKSYRITLKDR